MTASMNGTQSTVSATQLQQQIAQLQNRISSAAVGNATSSDDTGSASSSMARLAATFNSTGTNHASNQLSTLAGALGVDQTTLLAELQSGNSAGLSNLMALSALSVSSQTPASDPTAGGLSSTDSDATGLASLDTGATPDTGTQADPNLHSLLSNLTRTGLQFNGRL